ncbi:MAG: S41 family peptidase [Candidatus Gracilibacteria bacterium]|nr:S-layer homology domain-containing protein [Candidatus Peregrinibacteria bacterium]
MKDKSTFSMRIAAAMGIFLIIPQFALASFRDVGSLHPYYDAISSLEEKGIVKGVGENFFRPDEPVSKAAFFKIAFQHAGYLPTNGIYETPFTDVPADSWFAPYVKTALSLNLIKFNPDSPDFKGDQPITRLDALKLILPLEGIPAPLNDSSPLIFQDVITDSLSIHYIKAAQNAGIFLPEEQPYFFPNRVLTRAEAAYLVHQAEIYRNSLSYPTELPDFETFELDNSYLNGSSIIDNDKFPIFLNIWTKLNAESIYKDQFDPDDLIYGAISGMVQSIPDEQALFQDPESALEFEQSLTGNYEGIGTIIDIFEDQFLIVTILDGAPADKAGLKAGDIILKIDGEEVSSYSIDDLLDAIKGPSGTSLTMTVDRDGRQMTFTVTREEIALDTVFFQSSLDVPADIGYIAIYQFTETTALDFEQLLEETMASNPHGLIIDLRDNPGGYVDAAISILDLFIPKGEVIVSFNISGEKTYTTSTGAGNIPEDFPIMILVNENTASASEIVAGAMQVHDVATLIGTQTFGKGTVQEVNFYNDGSLFKFTIAEWLTPDEQSINHTGLIPDIVVEETKSDAIGETDSQLEKAIQEIQKR